MNGNSSEAHRLTCKCKHETEASPCVSLILCFFIPLAQFAWLLSYTYLRGWYSMFPVQVNIQVLYSVVLRAHGAIAMFAIPYHHDASYTVCVCVRLGCFKRFIVSFFFFVWLDFTFAIDLNDDALIAQTRRTVVIVCVCVPCFSRKSCWFFGPSAVPLCRYSFLLFNLKFVSSVFITVSFSHLSLSLFPVDMLRSLSIFSVWLFNRWSLLILIKSSLV